MSLVGLASPSPSTSLSSSVKASSSWSNSLRENSSSAAIGEKAIKRITAATSTNLNGTTTTTTNTTLKRKQATTNIMVEPVEPKLESERTTTEQKSGGVSILAANSFFNEFVDCMQNLPNRLQVLLTDLSTIDALVKKRHQTLELIKQELKKRTGNNTPSSSTSTVEPSGEFAIEKSMYESFRLEQLLAKLHQTLIESQHLGDQKLRVTSQIIETICNRTRQIGLDCKSNDERKFNFEINEDRIVSEFKQAVRKTRPLYPTNGFYPTTSSALAAAAAAANSSSQTASASRASARNSNSNNQLINNANLNNYSKHYQSPVKQASSQSLSNCGSPSTTTLALSVHHHHHHHHKRRRVHEDNDDESAATPGSQQHLKALSLNNAAVNQCRSPSSMSTTSTCSTSGRKPNYVLVSRANKIQHLKKQRKSEEPAPVKKNDRKLGRKLKPAKRMKKTQKMNKKMNGHKEDDENENDLGAEGDNDEDDEEDDEEDDVSLSNDEIEFGGGADLDDEDEARENTRKPKTPQQQQRYSRRRDSEEDDSNNSSVGGAAGDKIDSDVDMAELKPPNSSSNETESIKQLDDDENDFAASKNNTTEKENNKTNETSTNNTTNNNNNNNSENGNNMESSSSSSIKKKRTAITTTPNNNGNKQNANSDNNTSGGGGGGAVSSSSHRQLNEDEPVYCLCREISYGQMILCDNDACKIEWFHFQCVKLASKPKGKWYCPKCRGDSHRVMKKSHQTHLNTSSSTSMASPSHYSNYSSSSYSTRNK